VGIEPCAMLMASIDDDTGAPLEISPVHQRIADRTAPILDRASGRISTIDPRCNDLLLDIVISCSRGSAVDERVETIFGCPESMAFRAFVDFETADLTRAHPALTAGALQFRQRRSRRLRIKGNATSQTETRIIQIARIALWADQTAAINDLNDPRSAIIAVLILVLGDRATAAAPTNRCIGRDRRRRLERRSTATIEGAFLHHLADIVLGVTIWTGYELQTDLSGPYRTAFWSA
jgi:hypothetical protein